MAQSKEIIMKSKILTASLALVVLVGAAVLVSWQKTRVSSAQQDKIASLKELRDVGVISAQEYESKIQAVQAGSPAVSNPPASTSSGTRKEFIRDPSLDMNFNEFNVPAKWHFQGIFNQQGHRYTRSAEHTSEPHS